MADLDPRPTSIQSTYSLFRENKLFVNRRYQRKLVWTLREKQLLVESVLKKYPVPAILLSERDDGTYEIIDGLQRLHALVSFIEQAFPTLGGHYFDLKGFPTAKAHADAGAFVPTSLKSRISSKEITTYLDYTLAMSVMRNASEQEVDDVFGRINSYGHRLSDQERRQAGVENEFSDMVRTIAQTVRGDASATVLPLQDMPSISIDLPMSKHGYSVIASDVVWVEHGILRATDLRDSMDEQCIADIAACILGGQMVERSKDALDAIYENGSSENTRIASALAVYGRDRFEAEFKYTLDRLLDICAADPKTQKLRDIIFNKAGTSNPFPAVFAVIMIALHELTFSDKKKLSNTKGAASALKNLAGPSGRVQTSRGSTSATERQKNIDTVKGLLKSYFVKTKVPIVLGGHATQDIDSAIRRSEAELPDYELKQGILDLSAKRGVDAGVIEKVLKTLCAIANNGPKRSGKIIIGVTDTEAHAKRVQKLDGVVPRKVGNRFVVGVAREASKLKLSPEDYLIKWKDAITNSALSDALKQSVLSHLDYNNYFGLGVIVLTVPPQKELSYYDNKVYLRAADSTVEATTAKAIAGVATRF
jgi:hypothetical protein